MPRKYIIKTCLFIVFLFNFYSCSDDENYIKEQFTNFTFTFDASQNLEVDQYKTLKIKLTELNSGLTNEYDVNNNNTINLNLAIGTYDLTVNGIVTQNNNGNTTEINVSGLETSFNINGTTNSKTINLFINTSLNDLVIEEIFFTGSKTPEGQMYFGDQYFKITNNSDREIFADGLLIIQTAFMTVDKQDIRPNIFNEALSAGAIILLPGDGNTYPIPAGESIIIAEDAINHKEFNPLSIDLSNADFQIFKEDSDDIDNPEVPKVINVYDKWVIHTQGYYAYALARIPDNITNENLILQNEYRYEYDFIFGGTVYPMDGYAVKIPNEWVIDAVNLSVQSIYQWLVTSPILDMGWTSVTQFDGDENRFGKSVRRKIIGQTSNGKNLLKDTNNSTQDFDAGVKPSLFN